VWLRPSAVCILGIGGWRTAVDRKAQVGWQQQRIGPSRVYVMPNPSGLNASTQHAGFVEHLREVAAGG
jgi:TDG/mug DNA glycosylase family protein